MLLTILLSAVPLLRVVLIIIVVGVCLWLVNAHVPMHPTIKMILNAVVIIALIYWLLHVFGLWQMLTGVTV